MGKNVLGYLKTLLLSIFWGMILLTLLQFGVGISFEIGKILHRIFEWILNLTTYIRIPLLLLVGWIIQQEMKNYKENKIRKEKDQKNKLLTESQRWRNELHDLEKSLSPNHPDIARFLNRYAVFSHNQAYEGLEEAKFVQKRAIAIFEESLGNNHPDLAQSLTNLAGTYFLEGQYIQAEPLYKRAILIYEKALGLNNLTVATCLESLAQLYRKTNREADAVDLEHRVANIRAIKKSGG